MKLFFAFFFTLARFLTLAIKFNSRGCVVPKASKFSFSPNFDVPNATVYLASLYLYNFWRYEPSKLKELSEE